MKIATAYTVTQPQPISRDVVARHRFDWSSRVDINELDRIISAYPGRSLWIPDADELLVVSPWRNRNDIAAVSQISAIRRLDDLICAARDAAFRHGAHAFVMPEWNETRSPLFYERNGLDLFEDVVSFEIGTAASRPNDLRSGDPVRLVTIDSPLLDSILAIDHEAFPWLWRNSRLEFEHYLLTPGVEIWALRDAGGALVSYVGITSYAGWGHLDRIAVLPDRQGEGHGQNAVRFAIARLRQLGARRVGLSTQRSNLRSQQLYARIGFQQTRQNDYRIYGTLAPDAPLEARMSVNGIEQR
jgi:ribosomal protein S18 acetylase RimI-like enzyme